MSMNVPRLKQTSVIRTLSVTTRKDSISAVASVDITAMVERVQASYLFFAVTIFHFVGKTNFFFFNEVNTMCAPCRDM